MGCFEREYSKLPGRERADIIRELYGSFIVKNLYMMGV